MIIAGQYGAELPAFASLVDAERSLFLARDRGLQELRWIPGLPVIDCTPESLDVLEKCFFAAGSAMTLRTGYSVAHAIGFYLGEVYCRHGGCEWVVAEYAFTPGRYEIGVKRDLMSIMLTKGRLPKLVANKRMQSLRLEFKKYAA